VVAWDAWDDGVTGCWGNGKKVLFLSFLIKKIFFATEDTEDTEVKKFFSLCSL
jgi:hypothetical protein